MQKEEAVLALYDLGCSSEDIDDIIRVEKLRRKKKKEKQKKRAIAEIVREMEL